MTSQLILVVDDDPDTLTLLGIWLEEAGYPFIPVASKEEAIEKAKEILKNGKTLSMAVIDGLYGRGGEVAAFLKELFPEMRVIAYSSEEQTFGDVNLLKKGLPDELVDAVA